MAIETKILLRSFLEEKGYMNPAITILLTQAQTVCP